MESALIYMTRSCASSLTTPLNLIHYLDVYNLAFPSYKSIQVEELSRPSPTRLHKPTYPYLREIEIKKLKKPSLRSSDGSNLKGWNGYYSVIRELRRSKFCTPDIGTRGKQERKPFMNVHPEKEIFEALSRPHILMIYTSILGRLGRLALLVKPFGCVRAAIVG